MHHNLKDFSNYCDLTSLLKASEHVLEKFISALICSIKLKHFVHWIWNDNKGNWMYYVMCIWFCIWEAFLKTTLQSAWSGMMRNIKKDVTSLSGSPKRNSLSKRPGRRSAGSMESSRFVAPITTTSPRLSNPSIRARSVDTMELQDGHNETK